MAEKSSANSLPSENVGTNGVNWFGSGVNEENDTRARQAGRSDYPGKTNPPNFDGVADGGRDSIAIPMGVDVDSGPTKRGSTISKVPSI